MGGYQRIFMNYTPSASSTLSAYDNPIPGRDFILSLFNKVKHNLNREQIAQSLGLKTAQQKEALRRRLRAMERDGQLMFNQRKGYQIIDQQSLVTGVISLHRDGFGFVSYDSEQKDLFLAKNQLNHVFDGDIVQVFISPVEQGTRCVNKLIKIIERKTTHIAGILNKQGRDFVLIADSDKISHHILVDDEQLLQAKVGEYVNTKIIHYPTTRELTQVHICDVLGLPNSSGMQTKLALLRHGISGQWDQQLVKKAQALGTQVKAKDKDGRVDYRALPFVTIDGADAKDFDDAVYCEQTDSGDWRLLVAIADVSHYVKPNDLLDLEAQQRATSIYCPDQVIPMLPEALSNGLCSLNPNEDRLAIVCEMTINRDGVVMQSLFNEGVIHSHARLTYDQAQAMVSKPHSKMAKKALQQYPNISQHINDLHALYLDLIDSRKVRGAIDFASNERKLNLNKRGKITSIEPIKRHDAHRMIEEFMLCANVATANFLAQHKIASMYRVHAGPQLKKLTLLRSLLAQKGLQLAGGDEPTSKHYNELLKAVEHRDDASVIRMLLLRSQSQAEYSPRNQGHFGLAYQAYAHFTSPIRRYPDLITHRAIRAKIRAPKSANWQRVLGLLSFNALTAKADTNKLYPYDAKTIESLSVHCSEQSRQADVISREVDNALKCDYMQQFIGQSFNARVSGVTSFGLFVELAQHGVDGLVAIASFSQGEFVFDPSKQQLSSKSQQFSLGDQLNVTLKSVDLKQRKMNFVLSA